MGLSGPHHDGDDDDDDKDDDDDDTLKLILDPLYMLCICIWEKLTLNNWNTIYLNMNF